MIITNNNGIPRRINLAFINLDTPFFSNEGIVKKAEMKKKRLIENDASSPVKAEKKIWIVPVSFSDVT